MSWWWLDGYAISLGGSAAQRLNIARVERPAASDQQPTGSGQQRTMPSTHYMYDRSLSSGFSRIAGGFRVLERWFSVCSVFVVGHTARVAPASASYEHGMPTDWLVFKGRPRAGLRGTDRSSDQRSFGGIRGPGGLVRRPCSKLPGAIRLHAVGERWWCEASMARDLWVALWRVQAS